MRDFTLQKYRDLLIALKNRYSNFFSLNDFSKQNLADDIVILRHDVDRMPENALKMALIENELGLSGSYYFRIVPESFDKKIILEVLKLGHEIGYHYEDVDLVTKGKGKIWQKNGGKEQIIDHL